MLVHAYQKLMGASDIDGGFIVSGKHSSRQTANQISFSERFLSIFAAEQLFRLSLFLFYADRAVVKILDSIETDKPKIAIPASRPPLLCLSATEELGYY